MGNEVHLLARPKLRDPGISEEVKAVVFSPDGRSLLAAGQGYEDGAAEQKYYPVRLWDVLTGRVTRRFRGHSNVVLCAAFSPEELLDARERQRTMKLIQQSSINLFIRQLSSDSPETLREKLSDNNPLLRLLAVGAVGHRHVHLSRTAE
jgi:WD40 repeat protein